MGGLRSSRWGRQSARLTTLHARRLPIAVVKPLLRRGYSCGVEALIWPDGLRLPVSVVQAHDIGPVSVVLGAWARSSAPVEITVERAGFWLWVCSRCGRRVHRLYQPAAWTAWGCRVCAGLAYYYDLRQRRDDPPAIRWLIEQNARAQLEPSLGSRWR